MSINEMFATENHAVTTNARNLSGTAKLTTVASNVASDVIKQLNNLVAADSDDRDEYKDRLKASHKDNIAMDELIEELHPLNAVDVSFLDEIDDATLEGMLKSQQSKRSRSKSKTMTFENYKTMMTAAIAENLIRLATGKEKQTSGFRVAGSIEFTAAQLEELENDQEKLRKEIRNIQSKKSIMKSKADFSESDERWLTLLRYEQMLKDMRNGTTPIIVDETKDKLKELLDNHDLEHIKTAEGRELLEAISKLIEQ